MTNKSWLLLLLGLGLLLVLGVFLLWRVSSGSLVTPPEVPQNKTSWTGLSPFVSLQEAEQQATARTQAWAVDAQLIKASAVWKPSAEWLEVEQPPVAWSFYYYSAANEAIASPTVRGGEVFWSPPLEVAMAPTPLNDFPPPHGVNVAWLSFLGAGGEDFLRQHAGATVQFQLKQRDVPVWIVTAFTPEAHTEIKIDATSGKVLAE